MNAAKKLRYLRVVEGHLRGLNREMTQTEVVNSIKSEMKRSIRQLYFPQLESGRRKHLTNKLLVGLAISFALPIYAQQEELALPDRLEDGNPSPHVADPQTTQKILAIYKALNEAQNHDPAAYAANFTRDAVFVTPTGLIVGRQAIQKYYTDLYRWWHAIGFAGKLDGNAFHMIGTAGNEAWATGEWTETGQGKNGELISIKAIGQIFTFVRATIGRYG